MNANNTPPPWPAEFDQYAAEQAVAALPCPEETARIVELEREVTGLRGQHMILNRVREIAMRGDKPRTRLADIIALLEQ